MNISNMFDSARKFCESCTTLFVFRRCCLQSHLRCAVVTRCQIFFRRAIDEDCFFSISRVTTALQLL